MIIYNGKIITGLTGKWVIPNHAFDITYSTVPNGSVSGPSTAYGGDTITVTSIPGSGYLLDYITVNGVAIQGNTFTMPYGNVTVGAQFKINYNPLNLPPYTIRVGQRDATSTDTQFNLTDKGTATLVGRDTIDNLYVTIWDVTYNSNNWSNFFDVETKAAGNNLIKVYGANSAGVTNMSYMFRDESMGYDRLSRYYCKFDTSSVTNMEGMFYNNTFKSLSDIIAYDTHNVTNASYMYFGASFNNIEQDFTWPMLDLSKVTTTKSMFEEGGTNEFTYRITFPLFDLSKVVDAESMFHSRQYITVPKFNLSSLQNMKNMFFQCKNLIQNGTFDVPNLVNCYYTYAYCNYATINAYAQYQKMAAVPTVTDHSYTFLQCNGNGSIPNSWGGYGG